MVELAYRYSGLNDAPTLVLSHSLGVDSRMWTRQRTVFERYFRVLSVDTRGHGDSPTPAGPYRMDTLGGDFLELFDRLQLPRISWCGLSLGGMIGMWLASHAPDRVNRLALCCTAAQMPPASQWRQRAETVREKGTTASLVDATMDRWFTPAFRSLHEETVNEFREVFTNTNAEGYASCCEAIAEMDLRPDLSRIAADTLVLSGSDDPATPPSVGRELAETLRHSRFVSVPGQHLATTESPEPATAALLDHLLDNHG